MTTKVLRAAMKAIDKEIRVSLWDDDTWTVRTKYHTRQVREALDALGLEVIDKDTEGSRYDWINVFFVMPKETPQA